MTTFIKINLVSLFFMISMLFSQSFFANNNNSLESMASTRFSVEITDFTVQKQNDQILIKWSTASEIENAYFVLEKSTNLSNWKVVARLHGAGNSSIPKTYHLYDEKPNEGTSYYRLKLIDKYGKETFSNIININLLDEVLSVQIFPNPSDKVITLKNLTPVKNDGNNLIEIFNSLGSQVKMVEMGSADSQTINVEDLVPGVYYLKSGNSKLQKLLIER